LIAPSRVSRARHGTRRTCRFARIFIVGILAGPKREQSRQNEWSGTKREREREREGKRKESVKRTGSWKQRKADLRSLRLSLGKRNRQKDSLRIDHDKLVQNEQKPLRGCRERGNGRLRPEMSPQNSFQPPATLLAVCLNRSPSHLSPLSLSLNSRKDSPTATRVYRKRGERVRDESPRGPARRQAARVRELEKIVRLYSRAVQSLNGEAGNKRCTVHSLSGAL